MVMNEARFQELEALLAELKAEARVVLSKRESLEVFKADCTITNVWCQIQRAKEKANG